MVVDNSRDEAPGRGAESSHGSHLSALGRREALRRTGIAGGAALASTVIYDSFRDERLRCWDDRHLRRRRRHDPGQSSS